jgi:hypothetical protein
VKENTCIVLLSAPAIVVGKIGQLFVMRRSSRTGFTVEVAGRPVRIIARASLIRVSLPTTDSTCDSGAIIVNDQEACVPRRHALALQVLACRLFVFLFVLIFLFLLLSMFQLSLLVFELGMGVVHGFRIFILICHKLSVKVFDP